MIKEIFDGNYIHKNDSLRKLFKDFLQPTVKESFKALLNFRRLYGVDISELILLGAGFIGC